MFIPLGMTAKSNPVVPQSWSTPPPSPSYGDFPYPVGLGLGLVRRAGETDNTGKPTDPHGLVLEGWAQGYMVGSLIVIACITISNMRKGVLLHKLILLELILGIWHGFWILLDPPVYAWWLSISAIPLNISWVLHNVIAWLKLKPFLSKWQSIIFISTVILTIPYWIVEIYANFAFFHNINNMFLSTRPFEALCRDPWWIFTTMALIYAIKVRYELRLLEVIRISPRFAVMLGAMFVSICFIIVDVCAVTEAFKSSLPVGINPFWKLAFVFKCLTDAVILDDFKTALDRLRNFKISRIDCLVDANDLGVDSHLNEQWDRALQSRAGNSGVPTDPEAKRAEQMRILQLRNPAAYAALTTRAKNNQDPEKEISLASALNPTLFSHDVASPSDSSRRGTHHHQPSRNGMGVSSDTDTECDSFEHESNKSPKNPPSARVGSSGTATYVSKPAQASSGMSSNLPSPFGVRIHQVIPDLPMDQVSEFAAPSLTHSHASHVRSAPPSPSFHMPDVNMPGPSQQAAMRRQSDESSKRK